MTNRIPLLQLAARVAVVMACGPVFTLLLTAGGFCSSGFLLARPAEAASAPSAALTVLTPHEGAALNAESLRIQAVVAAVAPDTLAGATSDGRRRAGRDVGAIDHIEVAIDQQGVASVSASPCGRDLLLDERADLTNLADGSHTLSLTAYRDRGRRHVVATVDTTFTLDRTLPSAPRDLVEAHATPAPFACFKAQQVDVGRSQPLASRVHGRFVLGGQSDGVDLARDRVVLAAGGQTVVLEPGALRCDRRGDVCRYQNASNTLLQRLVLGRRGRSVAFRLVGGPSWPHDPIVHLRIGNDWGALDLATAARVTHPRPVLDETFAGEATIGPAGGTVQTTDAAGVVIRLIVPPDALTRDTLITATPLAAPPLAGQLADLHFGVKFEPEGLVFAQPARLEFDFGTAARPLTDHDAIYLVTSPLSRIPLVDNRRTGSTILTARLSHFSTVSADGLAPLFGNLADWDPRLADAGVLTFTELARLAEMVRLQLAMGCTTSQECAAVDVAVNELLQAVSDAVGALLPTCTTDVVTPTRAGFDHWKTLSALAQGLGLDSVAILDCARSVLDALVTTVAADGLAHPDDAAVDAIEELENQALALAFSTVASKAHGKKHDMLAAVIDQAGTAATGDPSVANLQRMIGLTARAQAFVFADLQRRVLEKSEGAARAAIARLQQSCDVSPTSTATDVAKELARTWVAFVNQDPTVAPTLAADFQTVVDVCGGIFATWVGLPSDYTGAAFTNAEAQPFLAGGGDLPLHVHQTSTLHQGTIDMDVSVSGTTVAMDVTFDGNQGDLTSASLTAAAALDLRFPKAGTLRMEIDHAWLTQATLSGLPGVLAFVRRPGGDTTLINNCLSASCTGVVPLPIPGAPADVTVPVEPGTFRIGMLVYAGEVTAVAGSGRVMTVTYTPTP